MDVHAPAGAEIASSVEGALDAADAFVVLISKRSATSTFFVFEVAKAIALADQRSLRIVPVVTERGAVVPPFLTRYLYVDAADRSRLEEIVNKIAVGIVDISQERERHEELVSLAQREIDDLSKEARHAAIRTELKMKEAELHLAQIIAKSAWQQQKAEASLKFAAGLALALIVATVTAMAPLIFPFVQRLLAETPYVLFIAGVAAGSVVTLVLTNLVSRRLSLGEKSGHDGT
jgi:hypothetical protein